jgi:hypothetical protein
VHFNLIPPEQIPTILTRKNTPLLRAGGKLTGRPILGRRKEGAGGRELAMSEMGREREGA